MSNEMLDRLAKKSKVGQDSFSSVRIPTIKLDGSGSGDTAGHVLKFANDSMEDLGNNLSLRIIRVRKKLMLGGEESKLFSNEYDSVTHDQITLYRQVKVDDKWSKPEVVATGTAKSIKEVHEVKVVSIVYAILNNELVKLNVKGSSLTGESGLYEYLDSFKPEHVFQFETDITVSKVQKNRAISFHRMHFKRGFELSEGFDLVEKYLDVIEGNTSDAPTQQVVGTTTKESGDDSFF